MAYRPSYQSPTPLQIPWGCMFLISQEGGLWPLAEGTVEAVRAAGPSTIPDAPIFRGSLKRQSQGETRSWTRTGGHESGPLVKTCHSHQWFWIIGFAELPSEL